MLRYERLTTSAGRVGGALYGRAEVDEADGCTERHVDGHVGQVDGLIRTVDQQHILGLYNNTAHSTTDSDSGQSHGTNEWRRRQKAVQV